METPAPETPADPTAETAAPGEQALDPRAELCTALGCEAGADDAALLAAAQQMIAASAEQSTAAQNQVADLQQRLDVAQQQIAAAAAAQAEEEFTEATAGLGEMPPDTLEAIKSIWLGDRTKGGAILAALPKKPVVAAASTDTPPAPVHQPENAPAASAADKAGEAEKLIKAVQEEGRFTRYQDAREEARRRKPELFS